MAFIINSKVTADKLTRQLEKTRRDNADALEKLSTGQVFTSQDPRPAERALANGLEFRMRSLAASKRNINDAVSLLQTAEGGFSEITNMLTRMKEINVSASSTTLTDRERRYLFIEYEALHDEINRVAVSTKFNGIPLLNGESEDAPEMLVFRIDDPNYAPESTAGDDDINVIKFEGLASVVATAAGLGLKSARALLSGTDEDGGISVEDARDLLDTDNPDYATTFDEALGRVSTQRAVYGAMQSRLNRAIDFNDVFFENIAAAKSKIADTDYAKQVARMAQNNVLMQATTALLAQTNMSASLTTSLLNSVLG